MKKNTLIVLLFLSTITLYSQVDKLRATYELTYQIDSTNSSNLKTERMILDIDKSISSYESERKYLKDSILKSNNPHSVYGLSKSKFKYKIYKNKDTSYAKSPDLAEKFDKIISLNSVIMLTALKHIKNVV
jgi:GLPGLI family protein